MGLLLSVLLSYAGAIETVEFFKHFIYGMLPDGEPDFQQLVAYYSKLLHKTSNPSPVNSDWTTLGGQGYLCLAEDDEGHLKSASIKFYNADKDSTAILFSTKISSFGQESVDSQVSNTAIANGDYGNNRSERYTTTTKTIVSNNSESFNVGQRNKSPTASYENISDPTDFSGNSFDSKAEYDENDNVKEKLTWHYRPRSPVPTTLPEIHFQTYDGSDGTEETVYTDEFLRSLDGIKFRPLQRTDPSGRRRSFKKRHSSSSTSSKDSRASREEELKLFTSLEEAEFEVTSKENGAYSSAPNLSTRSYSRSRSRENSKERRGNADESAVEDTDPKPKPLLSEIPKLGSFEEEKGEETIEAPNNEVIADEEEEDFWGNNSD